MSDEPDINALLTDTEIAGMRRALQQHAAGESMELHAAMDEIRAELLAMKAAQVSRPTREGKA